jgi:hypothetical protein
LAVHSKKFTKDVHLNKFLLLATVREIDEKNYMAIGSQNDEQRRKVTQRCYVCLKNVVGEPYKYKYRAKDKLMAVLRKIKR